MNKRKAERSASDEPAWKKRFLSSCYQALVGRSGLEPVVMVIGGGGGAAARERAAAAAVATGKRKRAWGEVEEEGDSGEPGKGYPLCKKWEQSKGAAAGAVCTPREAARGPRLGAEPRDKPQARREAVAAGEATADQIEEDFFQYNSFQYWRVPLPDVDLSDILLHCDTEKMTDETMPEMNVSSETDMES
ncbi:uncharacterized protein C9orf40 homolog [Latimeria chalumnae]|uniref:uncharacterized protein C9orf40 homolog n=1 Tax=Latimeria chalumnae TaxID=7897 RepID=UPI0003C11B8D|nr:PREDICTED: uncharacterized protein C9orf40 homolog [Latimeria chalumnae]|eukprot:XP_006005353.1 PREDICTED: uncharacterized protein C9orf40 homolog [Latimeria chalumnae]